MIKSSFQDSLKATIDERRAERDAQEKVRLSFLDAWQEVRDSVIFAVFREAANLLSAEGFVAIHGNENSNVSQLRVERSGTLRFTADSARLRVVCEELPAQRKRVDPEPPEDFEPSALTREQVERKVQTFVKHFA
jgi:hypothetical protein